jgi:class 3 adenylate cyclase
MDDIRAVMDDAGSVRAALLGAGSPGGQLCAVFAATYPERVVALMLHNTWPRVVSALDAHHATVRAQPARYGRKGIRSTGDGFIAAFDGPARAIACAHGAIGAAGDLGLDIRAGVHTGEVELLGDKVEGIAVHIGARIAAEARPCQVLVSSIVRDLAAGSGMDFEDRGSAELKGVPGEWHVYAARLSDRARIG